VSSTPMTKADFYAFIDETVRKHFGPDGYHILAEIFERNDTLETAMSGSATKAQMLEGLRVLLENLNAVYKEFDRPEDSHSGVNSIAYQGQS